MPDMLVKLYELPEYEALLPALNAAGIQLRRALPPERHIVSAWVKDKFGPHWASECETAMSRQPVSCLIAIKSGVGDEPSKLIGFSCYEATAKGFFGPTGVDPDARQRHRQSVAAGRAARLAQRGIRLRHHRRGRTGRILRQDGRGD